VLEKRSPGIAQVYNFASNFFHYRHVNALFLLENYGCVNKIPGSQGPGIFCTALVDFDYGLGVGRFPTPTTLDSQIAVMSRIQVVSDGRIFPFVPFDPWRYVYEGESALKRITDAITDGGAIGVKLYPPMGFAPYGNATLNPRPKWPVKDFPDFGKRLDQAMGALFSWCIQAQVPVLAHANPSNAAHPTYKKLGSPENWRTALAAYPKLRVCFGHFGGECLLDKPQACEGGSGWGMGFLQCLADQNGTNAYSDASYFADALEEKNRPALIRRLRAFYTSGGELARSRILYGSDWQMIAIEPRSDFYYQELELVIQQLESDFPGLANQFFIENAARYLGLGPNGATRKRIMDFVARHKGSANWLDAPVLNR
jgi:hypothetical protein